MTGTARDGIVIDLEVFKSLAQGLDFGAAIVSVEDWCIDFEIGRFFRWFEPSPEEKDSLEARIDEFKSDRAESRVANGRTFAFETKVTVDEQRAPLRVSVAPFYGHEDEYALVQVHSIAKEMEIQYLLDSYSRIAEKNAHELEKEKERVERLLLNIMPKTVVDEMKEYDTATPQRFESVSILMLDFVGFTDMTISQDPSAVISELNDIFSAFDRIADMFDCERVKTIGDVYIAVSGLPEQTPEHAQNTARLALRFRRYLERRNRAHPQEWIARIGINTGPVIGSLDGVQKHVDDLFGPGISFAARMESVSESMHITLNEDTMNLLKDDFAFTELEEREITGFGLQKLYALEGELAGRRF